MGVKDRNLSIGVYDPEKVDDGNERSLDGTLYNNGAIWLGSNENPTYVPETFDSDEAKGTPIHSEKYKSEFENDIVEKFFSDDLKKWVQYATFAAVGAFFMGLMNVILVMQNAG